MENGAASHSSVEVGCQHYKRHCKLVAPCCNKVYPCRFCHDESNKNHPIDRKLVREVVCSKCETRQASSRRCTKCFVQFGNYVCLICNLFDLEDRRQFHCVDCGMCRVGGRENYQHCKVCDMCMPNKVKDSHKCIENVGHDICVVCLEDLFSSRHACRFYRCGHMIHTPCVDTIKNLGYGTCLQCDAELVH